MSTILIAAHDAGGAEILSSWAKREINSHFTLLIEGPALNIFKRKQVPGEIVSRSTVFSGNKKFDFVLTGSSWASDLEKQAILFAKKNRLHIATYLDHWCNYQKRFELDNQFVFPDEIWVGDEYAKQIALKELSNQKIILKANPYFEDIQKEISDKTPPRNAQGKIRILYVGEPTSKAAETYGRSLGYTEFEALEGFLNFIKNQPTPIEKIRIRLHPSEFVGKYQAVTERFTKVLPIETSENATLAQDCGWADWVVGCNSMAMAIAVLAKKCVYCCIPKGGQRSNLPFPEIINLFNPLGGKSS